MRHHLDRVRRRRFPGQPGANHRLREAYTAVCAIDAAATGTLSNTDSVAAPAATNDTNLADNSATDTRTILAPAVITGSKTASGTFLPGGAVTYTVTLSNAGGNQGDNPGDEFVDTLPPQLTLVSATASSGTSVASVGTNSVSWNGAIPAGGSITVTIAATINAGASGPISNQGQIFFDNDANGSHNATVVTDDPAAGGTADATVFLGLGGPVTPPVPVPALRPLGVAPLAGLALAGLRWRVSGRTGPRCGCIEPAY